MEPVSLGNSELVRPEVLGSLGCGPCKDGLMPLFEMTSDVLVPVPSTTFAAE
jgi:hypothetical protein